MYGFISIENTVIVFGAGRGPRRGTAGCFVTFVTSPSRRVALDSTNYSQLWPARGDCGGQNHSPLFLLVSPRHLTFPSKRRTLAYWATGSRPTEQVGPSSHIFLLRVLNSFLLSSFLAQFIMLLLSQLLSESLLVEVDCVGEAGLHLWYLVTDDLHQHLGELHLQGLGLTKGVEAEV